MFKYNDIFILQSIVDRTKIIYSKISYNQVDNLELYISYDQLEAHQENGSTQTWDVFVNTLANDTLSSIEHPSLISEGTFDGVKQPIFWKGVQDFNPEINQISIQFIKPTEHETAYEIGIVVDSTSNTSGQLSEALAFTAMIFDFDPTLAVLKLSQMIKIIHRLKYIGTNYGKILDSFFSAQNKKFKIGKKEKDSNLRLSLESDNKMKHDEIPILLFRKTHLQSMFK